MAWNYASYMNRVAAAGKAEYPLPMYVNTWCFHAGAGPGAGDVSQRRAPSLKCRTSGKPRRRLSTSARRISTLRISRCGSSGTGNPTLRTTRCSSPKRMAPRAPTTSSTLWRQHDAMVSPRFAIDELGLSAAIACGHGAGGSADRAELRHAGATRPRDSGEPGQKQDGWRGGGRRRAAAEDRAGRLYPGSDLPTEQDAASAGFHTPPPAPRLIAALSSSLWPDEYLAAGSGPVEVTFSPNTPGARSPACLH